MEKENENKNTKNKLTPASTVILAIIGTLLAIVLYRVMYWAVTGV